MFDYSLTFTTTGGFVAQNVDLMHSAKLLEQRSEIVLVHVVRYLPYKHLYIVWIRLLHAVIVHYAVTPKISSPLDEHRRSYRAVYRSKQKSSIRIYIFLVVNFDYDSIDRDTV